MKSLLQKQSNFKIDLAYQEWLKEFVSKPSEHELNQMEKDLRFTLANNINYQPLQGA